MEMELGSGGKTTLTRAAEKSVVFALSSGSRVRGGIAGTAARGADVRSTLEYALPIRFPLFTFPV